MFFFLESMAAPPLKPAGVVNDFAGRLSSGETAALDQLSRCIYKSLECAIVVAILPSLDNGDIDQTANELYNRWGIGSRGSSNGALICLAIRDRKIRIETGYGAEGFLPDAIARRIIAAYQPLLTQGKFGAALLGMMAAIGQVAAGDKGIPLDSACFSAPMTATVIAPPQIAPLPHPRLFFLALVLLILFLLGTPAGRAMLPWILLMIFSGGGRNGGGGFGGGFGGGGFGGFGGGSSGGGGASGRF